MTKRLILLIFIILVVVSAVYALRDQKKVTTDSDKAYQAYMAGQDFLDRLYFRDAIAEFEKAVKLDTNFAMAYARLGSLYYSYDIKKDESVKLMARAAALSPRVKDKERLIIKIMQADIGGDLDNIQKYREEFIKKYPDCLEAHIYKVDSYQRKMDYENVIKEYEKILKIEPNYVQAYNMLAYMYYYAKNYDEAIENIKKYVFMASDQANPHDSYGELLMNIGKYDEAITEFKMADKIKPDLFFVQAHLANAYASIGRIRDAVGYYVRARDIATNKKDMISCDLNIARIYWQYIGDEKGFKTIKDILAKNPDDLSVLSWYGVAISTSGDTKKARMILNQVDSLVAAAIDTMPSNNRLGTKREIAIVDNLLDGLISSKEGNHDRAIAELQAATDSTMLPGKIWYRCFLGDAYVAASNYDKAKDVFLENLKDNPNYALTLIRLANLYKTLKQTDNQKETLLRYLSVMSGADDEVVAVKNARAELDRLLQS